MMLGCASRRPIATKGKRRSTCTPGWATGGEAPPAAAPGCPGWSRPDVFVQVLQRVEQGRPRIALTPLVAPTRHVLPKDRVSDKAVHCLGERGRVGPHQQTAIRDGVAD